MRLLVVLSVALVVAGCSSDRESGGNAGSSVKGSSATAPRVERCVERFFAQATSDASTEANVRRYIERMYCSPFAGQGWVYEDGTLNIAAYLFLAEGGSGERVDDGETVPCNELPADGSV